jgi:Cdc6-like AAA superfamily ATPase
MSLNMRFKNAYFIETNEFHAIISGNAKVFVGRKGTGKTATMSQAVLELRKDRRNLVVPIKPSSYELSGLIEILTRLKSDSSFECLLVNLWMYLIYNEIAVRAVRHARERAAGIGENTAMRELEVELESLHVSTETDLSTRLEEAVAALLTGKSAHTE